MAPILYWLEMSSPCRASWMVAKAAGVDVTLKRVDLMKGEHMADWYLKINPKHTVPSMDDGGLHIYESRAINRYLINQHASKKDLYPTDPKKRALVDMYLDLDVGTIYKPIGAWMYPQLFEGQAAGDIKDISAQLKFLEENTPLAQGKFITGDTMTIADISLLASVTFLEVKKFDFSPYPKVSAWINKLKAMPFYAQCNEGFEAFKQSMSK